MMANRLKIFITVRCTSHLSYEYLVSTNILVLCTCRSREPRNDRGSAPQYL